MKYASYRWYLLSLLLLIQAFSAVDRLALQLLTQDIKHDLSFTDTAIGALDGIAFALFFAVMGLPIAQWADRGHRGRIMAITTALWSAAVSLCGAAHSFSQFALARVIAAVGQAGGDPTTNSLIPDYFGRAERARAMTISGLSGPLGTVIGYGVAGWIGHHYGWRVTFVVLGLPGLLLAVMAALTIREPREAPALPTGARVEGQTSRPGGFWETCVALGKIVSFRQLVMAGVVSEFFDYAIYAWLPTFFIRSYGMKDDELGLWLSVSNGVVGFAAMYVGGELAHRFGRNNERLQLKAMAVLMALSTIALEAVFLTHDRYVALWLMITFILLCLPVQGPYQAIMATIVPGRMRATSIAIVNLLASLIGMGIGPLTAGMLSDLLHPLYGEESLRYTLLIVAPGYLWSAGHMWASHKTVMHDARMAASDSHVTPEREGASEPLSSAGS